jgi:hypothetical protein
MENENLQEEIKEIKYNIKQLEYVIKDLASITKQWDETTKAHKNNLAKTTEALQEENFVLQKLPGKVGAYLKQIIPDISDHIQKRTLKDFEGTLALCNQQLVDLSYKVGEVNSKVEICQNNQLKKKIISLIMNLLLLIAIGSGSSYLITTYLLSYRVYVTAPGDVNINDSMVTVWEAKGKTHVYDNKKTKK